MRFNFSSLRPAFCCGSIGRRTARFQGPVLLRFIGTLAFKRFSLSVRHAMPNRVSYVLPARLVPSGHYKMSARCFGDGSLSCNSARYNPRVARGYSARLGQTITHVYYGTLPYHGSCKMEIGTHTPSGSLAHTARFVPAGPLSITARSSTSYHFRVSTRLPLSGSVSS